MDKIFFARSKNIESVSLSWWIERFWIEKELEKSEARKRVTMDDSTKTRTLRVYKNGWCGGIGIPVVRAQLIFEGRGPEIS